MIKAEIDARRVSLSQLHLISCTITHPIDMCRSHIMGTLFRQSC